MGVDVTNTKGQVMNRAMRRAAANKNQGKVLDKRSAWIEIEKTLYGASRGDLEQEDINLLLTKTYATIERLAKADIDDDDFIALNEANVAAFCLGSALYHALTDAGAKAQIAKSQDVFEGAANALASMGERKVRMCKYRATGDELNAIRESLAWYSEMLPIANRGIVLKSLIRADQMITSKLKNNQKGVV